MKTRYKDRLGKDIYEGDIILYATTSGTGGRIECFKVLSQTEQRLKVTTGERLWGGKPLVRYIMHPESGVVLSSMSDPMEVFDLMNKQ